jgi:hypothetical protein
MPWTNEDDDVEDDTAGTARGARDGQPSAPRRGIRYARPTDEDEQASRSGLTDALERIAGGEASVLIAERLRDVGDSLRELVGVIEWLQATGGDLVAEDVGLDTRSSDGERVVTILREIASWEHQPGPRRPPRGRPGIDRRAPELTQRIAAMREDGMALQAIADALNAERVPTPRGGAQWRPSSVQSVLGYRRPRPPAPGLPRHPPHPRHPAPSDLAARPSHPQAPGTLPPGTPPPGTPPPGDQPPGAPPHPPRPDQPPRRPKA